METEFLVLGPLEVRVDGRPIDLGGRKRRLLLSLLLANANERVSDDRLIEGIWGQDAGDGTVHTLRVHISNLRKILEPDHERGQAWTIIETIEDGYRLQVGRDSLDSHRFERLADEGRTLAERGDDRAAADVLRGALDLWRGAAYGELATEPALQAEAVRLEELRVATIEDRVDADLGLGRHHAVIAELRDVVDLNPFRERLRGLLMLALYRAGRQAEALRAYRSLVSTLGDELGIEPSQEIVDLEERILLQDPSLDLIPPAAPAATNVPAATTSFVGRGREVARAHELLDRTRLLTFLGPGGVGKTRLALEAADGVADRFADGVWLVELAPLRDPTLVGPAIAGVLGIDQQPSRPVAATLADRLRDSTLLLILDNCEHLIDGAAAQVDSLLQGCPGIRVWATSRQPLGLTAETHLRVPSLDVPADAEAARTETLLADHGAIRLFVDRAGAASPGFELSSENASAVAQICRRLDGIPLAIELAAARVTILTPHQIAAGLDDRFGLLTTGSRTAQARHQTLKGTLDWSYELLTEPEQAMLRRLAVFRGTFGLDAIEAVCRDSDGGGNGTLDVLGGLVAKSLVVTSPSAEGMRYELLDTVRLYARARLTEAGDETEALTRHRDWYVAVAERAGPQLRGADQVVWLQRLEADHDNLRAVMERSNEADDIDTSLRIAGSISGFWFLHSHLSEGWDRLERLIAESDEAPHLLRLRVLISAAQFAWEQSRDDQAQAWLEEALLLGRMIESRTHTGWALCYLGLLATLEGRWDDGTRLAGEARDSFEATGNLGGFGYSVWIEAAASYFRSRDAGVPAADRSAEYVDRVGGMLDVARQVGERNFIGHLEWSLAIAAHDEGDYVTSARHLSDALRAFEELGNKSCAGHTLDQVACLAYSLGKPKRAARLLAATEALRSSLGIPGHVLERTTWEECRREVVDALAPDELDEAWRDGARMDLHEAIGYALSDPAGPAL